MSLTPRSTDRQRGVETHRQTERQTDNQSNQQRWKCNLRHSAKVKYARSRQTYWASSTGLTAVSKFEHRLPAQWAVGTHRKGPSRMEKVTSRMNWPIRNSTQIRKLKSAYRQNHNTKHITLFLLQNAKPVWSLKRSHHNGMFMFCLHGTCHA